MKQLLDKGADPNARVNRKVWYTRLQLRPVWRRRSRRDAVLARRLRHRRRRDEAAGVVRRRPEHPDDEAARARRESGDAGRRGSRDVSGVPPVPTGGPGMPPLLAAAGAGYGEGFAGNAHRFAPGGMLAAVKYLVEELGADVNAARRRRQHRAAPRRVARRQRDDSVPGVEGRRRDDGQPRAARPRSTWPTARCSARSRIPRRSSCSRASARRTTTSACRAEPGAGRRVAPPCGHSQSVRVGAAVGGRGRGGRGGRRPGPGAAARRGSGGDRRRSDAAAGHQRRHLRASPATARRATTPARTARPIATR